LCHGGWPGGFEELTRVSGTRRFERLLGGMKAIRLDRDVIGFDDREMMNKYGRGVCKSAFRNDAGKAPITPS